MKRYFSFLICAAMLSFVACDKSDNNDEKPAPAAASALGKMSVTQTDGTVFTQDCVSVNIAYDADSATITMLKVKFAERMPLELDMTIGGVQYNEDGGIVKLSGNNIVPVAMGGPFPKYTITNFEGESNPAKGTFRFSMMCGENPTSYEGALVK